MNVKCSFSQLLSFKRLFFFMCSLSKQAEKLKSRKMKVEGGGDVEKLILWGFGS